MVRAVTALVMAVGVLTANPAFAEDEKGVLGVGLIVGEPTGISAKYYLGNDLAIDAAAGGTFIKQGFHFHTDLLFHPLGSLQDTETFHLPMYMGPGIRLLYETPGGSDPDAIHTGVRGVIGILFDFTNVPLDTFIEIAGILDYRFAEGDDDGVRLRINAGAGVRYYF